jgi:uncharacterized membrane protein
LRLIVIAFFYKYMQSAINTVLLSVIASLLAIIVNYIKKMVDKFELVRDKVNEHEIKIKQIEEQIK